MILRKPHEFKEACLSTLRAIFGADSAPFYAGFGNRLTDALSYRSVSIPSKRIFTINSYAEVSLDLLSLNKLRYSYVNMREVVDHYFPPITTLVKGGDEEYTDFTYWRDPVLEIDDFSASDDEGDDDQADEEDEEEGNEALGESFMSNDDDEEHDPTLEESILSGSVDEDEMTEGMLEEAAAQEALEDEEGDYEDADQTETLDLGLRRVSTTASEKRRRNERDQAAEIITGIKGVSLEMEDSDDHKV